MKTVFFCLLAVLLVSAAEVGRACEYCRMAAEDPEAARLALAAHASSGAFPLQTTINQFKGDVPPAVLTAPPTAGAIATSAADLPARPRRIMPVIVKASAPSPAPAPAAAAVRPAGRQATWADAGLLGVFGCLGFFGWRTRRTPGSVH